VPAVTIRSLKPNVTRSEAVAALEGGWARRWRPGRRLRSVAEAYVPFRLYEVEIENKAGAARRWFGLEAVTGMLDLYGFDTPPVEDDLVVVETRNRLEAALGEQPARCALEDKVRRLLFQGGFFRARRPSIRAIRAEGEFHVPYWIGFYPAGDGVRLRVQDAVRRRIEGAKARVLFESWLLPGA
jgi:hypothetical protein